MIKVLLSHLVVFLCLFCLAQCKETEELLVEEDPLEETSNLIELDGEMMEKMVFKGGKEAWVVLVTASGEQCPQCEAWKGLVDSAFRSSKNFAKFGFIDVMEKKNQKILSSSGQMRLPEVRLYIAPGMKNAYKKNSYYREYESYNGQQNARALKRFIFDNLSKDAPIEEFEKVSDGLKWLKQQSSSVVALSSKDNPSALIGSIGRYLEHSNVNVCQFSSLHPNLDKDDDEKALSKLLGGSGKVPSLFVQSEKNKWVEIDLDLYPKANFQDILKFIEDSISIEFQENEESNNKGDEKLNKQKLDFQHGIIRDIETFDDAVGNLKLPGVVAVRYGKNTDETPKDWKKFREKSHGVGMYIIYCNDEEEYDDFLKQQCGDDKEKNVVDGWEYRLYEFTVDPKEREYIVEKSLTSARSNALASVPETIIPISSGMMNGFVGMGAQSNAVPVILFGKQKDPPAMLTNVAAALQGLALIGYRANPTPQELETEFGLPSNIPLPVLAAMIIEKGEKPEESRVMVSVYDKQRFGKYSFHSILSFILQVQQQSNKVIFDSWLKENGNAIGVKIPDDDGNPQHQDSPNNNNNQDDHIDKSISFDDPTSEMGKITKPQQWDTLCSDNSNQMLCVISFVDGNPLNTDLESQLKIVQNARETLLAQPNGRARLRFMWVDATCQEEFTKQFQVDLTALPSMVVFHPKKLVAFKYFSGYNQEKMEKFLTQVVMGFGKQPYKFESTPKVQDVDCASLPSREQIDDDDDDEDWLAEIKAEEERERKEKEEELLREMEEEKRKLEEEANKKNIKKRRRRRRRKKKDRDEL